MLFGKRKQNTPRIGLALAAGGAKGVAYIPFLEALEEMDVTISAIAGSSVGSLIGGLYASGVTTSEMVGILEEFKPGQLNRFFRINWFGRGLISGESVRDFLERNLKVHTFEETHIPFTTVATDYWRREQVVFRSGSLVDAIRASTAVPAVFEPAVMGDRMLIDGGVTNTLPYELIRDQCDILVGLDVSNRSTNPDRTDVPRAAVMVLNTFRILTDNLTRHKIEYEPLDLYFRVMLPTVEMLDFHKYKQIFTDVQPEVEKFRGELQETLDSYHGRRKKT
jgi:NTE family protein